MSLEQDVAAAGEAVDQPERACGRGGRAHAEASSATGTWGDGFADGTVGPGRGRP
jgi:hypothetical protein